MSAETGGEGVGLGWLGKPGKCSIDRISSVSSYTDLYQRCAQTLKISERTEISIDKRK